MPKLAAVVAAAVLVLACGGSKKDPDRPGGGSDAGGGGAGNGSAVTAGDGSGGTGGGAATGAITRAECEAMVGHILDIGAAEQPAEKRPTPEALAKAKQNMIEREDDMQQCMAFDRAIHTCVMTATTVAAIGKCLGEP
jgi:hypothetical protein